MRLLVVAALGLGPGTGIAAAGDRAELGDNPATAAVRFYQRYVSDLRVGHCYFQPSCSAYAVDALDRYGVFLGAALTADRLIRCNPGAHRYHSRSTNGRLSDPVIPLADIPDRPRVPDWLLPPATDDPFPPTSHEADSGRLREYAAFGDHLAENGDCWRAETEFGRAAFLAGTDDATAWARRRAGHCYYRWENWRVAADRFLETAGVEVSEPRRDEARLMAGAALFNAGDYERTVEMLREHHGAGGQKWAFLVGLGSMARGDWVQAALDFESIGAEYPGSPNLDRALFLRWKTDEGRELPRRRPNLAAGLSAVIPGAGQAYTGRFYDGFRHLLVNGALIYGVYRLLKAESYVGGYILAGFTLPFYVGNIVGAKRSAESYNATRRTEFVSRVIIEASHE